MVKETKNVSGKQKHSLDVNRDGGEPKSKSKSFKGKRNKAAFLSRISFREGSRKSFWEGLVGLTVEEVENMIKEKMPHLFTQVLRVDGARTLEYRYNRVRIFIDSSGKVAKPPNIG